MLLCFCRKSLVAPVARASALATGATKKTLQLCLLVFDTTPPGEGGNLNCAGAHHGNPTSPRNARSYVQEYGEWLITGYECPIYGVREMLGEYESLDKLNYLAVLTDEFSLSDQEKLVVIMEAECDDVSDIDDLINLTFNLDYFDVMPSISDESDLG